MGNAPESHRAPGARTQRSIAALPLNRQWALGPCRWALGSRLWEFPARPSRRMPSAAAALKLVRRRILQVRWGYSIRRSTATPPLNAGLPLGMGPRFQITARRDLPIGASSTLPAMPSAVCQACQPLAETGATKPKRISGGIESTGTRYRPTNRPAKPSAFRAIRNSAYSAAKRPSASLSPAGSTHSPSSAASPSSAKSRHRGHGQTNAGWFALSASEARRPLARSSPPTRSSRQRSQRPEEGRCSRVATARTPPRRVPCPAVPSRSPGSGRSSRSPSLEASNTSWSIPPVAPAPRLIQRNRP